MNFEEWFAGQWVGRQTDEATYRKWAELAWDVAIASQQPIWMERIGELEAEIERLSDALETRFDRSARYEAVVEVARTTPMKPKAF